MKLILNRRIRPNKFVDASVLSPDLAGIMMVSAHSTTDDHSATDLFLQYDEVGLRKLCCWPTCVVHCLWCLASQNPLPLSSKGIEVASSLALIAVVLMVFWSGYIFNNFLFLLAVGGVFLSNEVISCLPFIIFASNCMMYSDYLQLLSKCLHIAQQLQFSNSDLPAMVLVSTYFKVWWYYFRFNLKLLWNCDACDLVVALLVISFRSVSWLNFKLYLKKSKFPIFYHLHCIGSSLFLYYI